MTNKKGAFWLLLALGGGWLFYPAGEAPAARWPSREMRLEQARAQAAEELAEFYISGENWYSCWQALQKLERLEEK